ncbi:penicillin-binding protein 1C [Anaerolineales bacterium HSG6]|nr:penicillin-binding protein 1C [Anaerolineales bacterium HSG6]
MSNPNKPHRKKTDTRPHHPRLGDNDERTIRSPRPNSEPTMRSAQAPVKPTPRPALPGLYIPSVRYFDLTHSTETLPISVHVTDPTNQPTIPVFFADWSNPAEPVRRISDDEAVARRRLSRQDTPKLGTETDLTATAPPFSFFDSSASAKTEPPRGQTTPPNQPAPTRDGSRRRAPTRPNQVVPSAPPKRPAPRQPHAGQRQTPPRRPPVPPTKSGRSRQKTKESPNKQPKRSWWKATIRTLSTLSVLTIFMLIFGLAVSMIGYFWIASQLPPAHELKSRSAQFATTKILDSKDNVLWEIIDPQGGRRTWVSLNQISPHLRNATVATEDENFYINVGVDPIAIMRAVYYNLTEGDIVSGGSTITQQLARNVLLPEERTERSYTRKIREAVLAVEVSRRYSKEEILEIYLNQIYYGNLAYGIEAASQTYFNKSAADLSLAEASMLAGLPQSPAVHDPYTNLEGAKDRQADVLRLMVESGYINASEAQVAYETDLYFYPVEFNLDAPHFVNYVRQELEQIVPTEYIYRAGLRVQTTLDPYLQEVAETQVSQRVAALNGYNVTNGALISLDAQTGQILAMVGSADFNNEAISGQVNLSTTPRQVGSTMKPHVYLAAFEQLDWTASTLLMDVPVEYPDGAGGVYRPRNYDEDFRGPVLLRHALANSYNIPAVKALEQVGIEELRQFTRRLGITTLTRPDYGLALALGGGEVSLLEMTGSYQAMANGGVLAPPTAILQITDSLGRVIEPAKPQPQAVLSPQHAFLMTHMLADNEARQDTFGPNSALQLSRPAAVKTGTTNDFRDNWTIGYTPRLVTGVWVGNSDNTPMYGVSGVTGAGPIWNNFMEQAHADLAVQNFNTPAEIVQFEICADSGTIPSQVCPQTRPEIYYRNQPPLDSTHDIHQLIPIDRPSGLLASEACPNDVEERYYQVFPPDGREWALNWGIPQPPEENCPAANIKAKISSPLEGSSIQGVITLEGIATAANFSHYQIELGVGTNPQSFMPIYGPATQPVTGGVLASFDSTEVDNGPYTIQLAVVNRSGVVQETQIRVLVNNPLPTITPTPTEAPIVVPPTDTPTVTPTPLPTETPTEVPLPPTFTPIPMDTPTTAPTSTPIPIATSTPIPIATDTPIPIATDTPIPIATSTDSPVPLPTLTNTPASLPTDTPPIEEPTATIPPEEPTATLEPELTPTDTPIAIEPPPAENTATFTPEPISEDGEGMPMEPPPTE